MKSKLHHGSLPIAYTAAAVLIAAAGIARTVLLHNGDVRAPFLFFYPSIAAAAFFGGLGPALLTIVAAGVFGCFLFPAFPTVSSWLALALLGPSIAFGFARWRGVRENAVAIMRECERFRFISEHVSDWIFLTDRTGSIQYANRTASRQLGWEAEELFERRISELTDGAAKGTVDDLVARCDHTTALPATIDFVRRDGAAIAVETVFTGVRVSGELVIHIAGRDTAERRQIEQKLRDGRQWESLGVMAGGLAHDFNNLLTSIMGNASLAKDSIPQEDALTPLLESIERAGERCAELVRLMLATAGYRPRYRERLRLDRIVDSILTNRPLPPHVPVNCAVTDAPFMGDERSMETLLWALISNAAESFGESAGEVHLAIEIGPAPDLPPGEFDEGAISPARCLRIAVEDRGCGMPPEVLQRAFDPFFSTKFTGRGLGLPAVRGIVRAHSGRLWLRTKPSEGTRVEVCLPLEASNEQRQPQPVNPRNQASPPAAANNAPAPRKLPNGN